MSAKTATDRLHRHLHSLESSLDSILEALQGPSPVGPDADCLPSGLLHSLDHAADAAMRCAEKADHVWTLLSQSDDVNVAMKAAEYR